MMNEIYDIDEIETQLYNQVYHSSEPVDELNYFDQITASDVSVSSKMHNRYFGMGARMNRNTGTNLRNLPRSNIGNQKRPIEERINQIVFVNSYKNYFCFDDSKKQQRKLNKARRKALQKARKALGKVNMLNNAQSIEQKQDKPDESKLIVNDGGKQSSEKSLQSPQNEIICVSDSDDDDDCVVIPKVWPVLHVYDSDEEIGNDEQEVVNEAALEAVNKEKNNCKIEPNNSNSDNDKYLGGAILIETLRNQNKVINLDETIQSNTSERGAKFSILKTSQSYVPKERKELLSTPESNSNDFLDNSGVDIVQHKFNFSLHGSDFNNGDFVRPANPVDTYETGSSTASTTDINLCKTVVFNEVEFPKEDLFSEANLESFGNYITPKRPIDVVKTTITPSIQTIAKSQNTHMSSSGSSSESDFEESKMNYLQRKDLKRVKDLPCLSPMQSEDDNNLNSKAELAVKGKKRKAESHSQVADSNNEDVMTIKRKKRRNNKRKCDDTPNRKCEINDNTKSNDDDEAQQIEQNSKLDEQRQINKLPIVIAEHEDECSVSFEKLYDSNVNTSTLVISSDSDLSALEDDTQDIQLINLNPPKHSQASSSSMPTKNFAPQRFRDSWNADKDIFYNTVVNVENFELSNVTKSMSDDPKLWEILERDRFNLDYVKERKCNICYHTGHISTKCPKYRDAPKCRLCGQSGHLGPRCPIKICRLCGKAGEYVKHQCRTCYNGKYARCRVCSLVGHSNDNCPDLWRRYHATVTEGPIVPFRGSSLKPIEKLWCSGCAQNGHLEYNCKKYISGYPPADPVIHSYEDIYQENNQTTRSNQQQRNFYTSPNNQRNELLPRQNFHQRNIFNYSSNYNQSFTNHVPNPVKFVNPWLLPAANNLVNLLSFGNIQNSLLQLPTPQVVPIIPNNIPNTSAKDNFYLDGSLPNFISFDENKQEQFNRVNQGRPKNNDKWRKQSGKGFAVFNHSSVNNIQQLLYSDFRKLSQLEINLDCSLPLLRKQSIAMERGKQPADYRKLNMILFGLFQMEDGKHHLDALNNFRAIDRKSTLNKSRRLELFDSYNYIFGNDKHAHTNYDELFCKIKRR